MDGLRDFIAKRERWQAAAEAARVTSQQLRAELLTERASIETGDTDEETED